LYEKLKILSSNLKNILIAEFCFLWYNNFLIRMIFGVFLKNILFVLLILITLISASCSTLKVGVNMLMYKLDGAALINNEQVVKNRLEDILLEPENYSMRGYTRRVFSPELNRTAYLYHSYFVVIKNDRTAFTLSFTGTKKWPQSIGVWAINTDFDTSSYNSYLHGNNEWDVQEIYIKNGINIEMTIRNILYRIENNYNYYYNDHRKDKRGKENCNTAMQNTMVIE